MYMGAHKRIFLDICKVALVRKLKDVETTKWLMGVHRVTPEP